MTRAGLDALLADADALASRLAEWPGDPTGARDVVEGLAKAVRDLRDERDEALDRVGVAYEGAWSLTGVRGPHRMAEWQTWTASQDLPHGTVLVTMAQDVRLEWDGARLVYRDGARELAASRPLRWEAGAVVLVERHGALLRVWVSADAPLDRQGQDDAPDDPEHGPDPDPRPSGQPGPGRP